MTPLTILHPANGGPTQVVTVRKDIEAAGENF
jgi:hypothetical protein